MKNSTENDIFGGQIPPKTTYHKLFVFLKKAMRAAEFIKIF